MSVRILISFALLAGCLQCNPRLQPADLIIQGGKIYTVDEKHPTAEAVAVRDGKIIYVGNMKDVSVYHGDKTNVIDLRGKTMMPGFIEGHGHIMGIGYNEMNLDLMDTKSFDEIVARVKEAVKHATPGQWIVGRGWHQDKWETKPEVLVNGFPVHTNLSAVSPDNPVFLSHASGHAAFANAKAMEIAGVNVLSREKIAPSAIAGGEIIRDKMGNPTGLFSEHAMAIVAQHIPRQTPETDRQALSLAIEACHRNGITSFHDAGAFRTSLELFHAFKKENKLSLRLYAMVEGTDPALVLEWLTKGIEVDTTHWLTIRSIKLHCDGALGSRGAWLLEPYTDRPGFYGMATYPMDSVLAVSRAALKAGFQVCSHAIGDRTNREVLDRYEIAFNENPSATNHRFRIEHAQHLSPNDIPRFGKLGVIPSMQAIHMASDRPWAIERLGAMRIKEGAYMWQSLIKTGAVLMNGTDAPVEPINPIACFYASVTRKTLKGEPAGGYEPEQKMTRDEALRSYTINNAYGAFEERIKGSIEVGKLADFTIFSQDLMSIPEEKILETKVVMTICDGKIVYDRDKK